MEGASPYQGIKDHQRWHEPLDNPLSLTTMPPMVLSCSLFSSLVSLRPGFQFTISLVVLLVIHPNHPCHFEKIVMLSWAWSNLHVCVGLTTPT